MVIKKETILSATSLPEEIIENIFARLPAKTVLRCHCLSHAWAVTLSSEIFVEHHLMLANSSNAPKLVISQGPRHGMKLLLWSPENSSGTPITNFLNRRLHRITALTNPCRGLVLLEGRNKMYYNKRYYIYNSSTQDIKVLPAAFGFRHALGSIGLGYHPLTKEYKVVLLNANQSDNSAGCEVFTIGSKGQWRPAASGAKPPVSNIWCMGDGIFAHGHMHWLVNIGEMDNMEYSIISFCMGDETFGFVQPPPGLHFQEGDFKMTELGGCLCLFSTKIICRSQKMTYDMWMLRDYDACVWELHCRIDAAHSILEVDLFALDSYVYPLAFIGDSRHILFMYYRSIPQVDGIQRRILFRYSVCDHQMLAYSPTDLKALDEYIFEDRWKLIWSYEESLVKLVTLGLEAGGDEFYLF